MPVLINFKICDNAKECNGISVCPTGALSWDEENETIKIDNSKCIECKKCEKACEVDAISVAEDKEGYEKIKKEIEEDPREVSDLFVDRYGAQPIAPAFLIKEDDFELEVLQASKVTVVEVFKENSIRCLRFSIPIRRLLEGEDVKYRKLLLEDDSFLDRYNISKLPSLLFFEGGGLIGKIEGYFETDAEKELKKKIDKIIQ